MGIKIKGKRGIFFTFIAITLMAAIMIIFTPTAGLYIGSDKQAIRTRVLKVNDYVVDLQSSYFENLLKVSSFKGIEALISHIDTNRKFLDDVKSNFSEVVLNGTIKGQKIASMEGNTIHDWLDIMSNISKNALNVDTEFEVNNVEISQIRPWFVEIMMNISMLVTSESSVWNSSGYIVSVELSIQDFEDPYYIVQTNSLYRNNFTKSSVLAYNWYPQDVINHVRNGTYIYWPDAPSFLMRFEGDIAASECCGIESLINPVKLSGAGIPDKDTIYTDYQFWETEILCDNSVLYEVLNGAPEFADFKLNFNHIVNYNLTDDSQLSCPP